jgi:hypothetical protein
MSAASAASRRSRAVISMPTWPSSLATWSDGRRRGLQPETCWSDAAVLLAEVVTVEDRAGVRFVGLDAGWNVFCSWFIYRFAQEVVLCRAADALGTTAVTVAGHINEAGDVFVEDYLLPPVREGDVVALLNAGGYEQAMSMTHCLRPLAAADFLERTPPTGSAREERSD